MSSPPLLPIVLEAQAVAGPVADAGAEYVKAGLLGAAVVVLAVVVYILYRANTKLHEDKVVLVGEKVAMANTFRDAFVAQAQQYQAAIAAVQAQRVADWQAAAAQQLKTSGECVAALTSMTTVTEAQTEAMGELKTAFRDLSEEVRLVLRQPPRSGR